MFFEVRGRIFFSNDSIQVTFVDFRFMLFTKVLMKELARILIHFHKIFNHRDVNYFRKKFNLRCLIEFWMCLLDLPTNWSFMHAQKNSQAL